MEISVRNQLKGRITRLQLGTVMAEVEVDVGGGNVVVAAITRASAEALALKEGDEVRAIIKATEVLIGK